MGGKPNPREVLYQQRPDLIPSWATRIPAAIKRAEVKAEAWRQLVLVLADKNTDLHPHTAHALLKDFITPVEAALAEALWEQHEFEAIKLYGGIAQPPPPALIAFTEKVEAHEVPEGEELRPSGWGFA